MVYYGDRGGMYRLNTIVNTNSVIVNVNGVINHLNISDIVL